MVAQQIIRLRFLAAIATLCGLTTAHVTAQNLQAPTPSASSDAVSTMPHIDLYYGNKHVNPRPLPVPAMPVVADTTMFEKSTQANEKSATRQPNGLQQTRAEVGVTNGNTLHPQIVIIRETVSAPEPGHLQLSSASLPVAPAPQPAPQPTIVVVREPAETHAVEPTGIRISQELVAILAVGFTCFTVLLVILVRMPKQVEAPVVSSPVISSPVMSLPVAPPTPLVVPEQSVQTDDALLDGKYQMGPLPETAERFDIGPSYHEELLQKKHDEESSRTAVVAQILSQNTALFDEIAKEKLTPSVEVRNPIAFHGIVLPDAKS